MVATSPYFVLEQIDLAPFSEWEVEADREVWILMVKGEVRFDLLHVACGEAVFIDAQCAKVHVGASAVRGLMAYVGSEPVSALLQRQTGGFHEMAVGRPSKRARARKLAPVPATHHEVHV